MTFTRPLLPFALMLSTALPALAQETAAPEAAPEPETVTEAPEMPDEAPAEGAETGTTAADAPAAAPAEGTSPEDRVYTSAEHGDWQIRCVRADEGEDPCQLYQLLEDGAGGSVAEVTLTPFENEDAVALATIITPLETLLPQGLALSVDGQEPRRFGFDFCTRQGCWVRIPMRQADVDVFRRGRSAVAQIVPVRAPNQTVDVEISLSGFTAAWDAVSGE